MIPLYTKRGYRIKVSTSVDKSWLLSQSGAEITGDRGAEHPWLYPDVGTVWYGQDWSGNKAGCNLSRSPMPNIGHRDDLWPEYCRSVIPLSVSSQTALRIKTAYDRLPRPIILIHSIGNTNQHAKSIPKNDHIPLYGSILDRTDGTAVVLDWDSRCPVFPHYRLRLHKDLFGSLTLEELTEAVRRADLVVGIDSGPFHLAGLTGTPRLGLFRDGHYPSTYVVPSPDTWCLASSHLRDWNIHKRIPFRIVETNWLPENVANVAGQCLDVLSKRGYGPVISQFLSWCRGSNPMGLSSYCDRHRGFNCILSNANQGKWVETGTIRSVEDWSGAGYSTYLFGYWLWSNGGNLWSVDTSQTSCEFARRETAVFGDTVSVVNSTGEEFIRQLSDDSIDLLYLDSCDTDVPEHAEVCLGEAKAGLSKLRETALVGIDDTPFSGGAFIGKGKLAIPFLLNHGWRILYAGYQVILIKQPGG